jgi:hypothetical protein
MAPGRARSALVTMRAKGDAIQEAAAKLTTASYPFMKQVPWNSEIFTYPPGKHDPVNWAKAIGKIIDMGASMDSDLVKAGCGAHHDAIVSLGKSSVCSEEHLTEIYAGIGRMIASVPESKTMDVYNAVSALVDEKAPAFLMSQVNEKDAKAAYEELLKFTEVVKANPITPSDSATTVSTSRASSISTAASELGAASYPLVQGVDWTSDLYGIPPPGKTPKQVLKAVDKMIVMGQAMDGAALKEAAMAHVKAIEGMDSKGVLTQGDFVAILAGLGKAISSAPSQVVMDVYTEMGKVVFNTGIPQYMYSMQKPQDAIAAYTALLKFKDEVRGPAMGPAEDRGGFFSLFLVGIFLFFVFALVKG